MGKCHLGGAAINLIQNIHLNILNIFVCKFISFKECLDTFIENKDKNTDKIQTQVYSALIVFILSFLYSPSTHS